MTEMQAFRIRCESLQLHVVATVDAADAVRPKLHGGARKKSRLKQTVDNVVRRQFPVFSAPAICRSRLRNSVDPAVTYILSTCLVCRIMHAENAAGTLIYESIFTKTKQKRRLEVIAVSSVAVVDVRSVI